MLRPENCRTGKRLRILRFLFRVRSGICFAPWSDAYMEELFIDPCFEGVYKKLTGRSAPALAAVERERERMQCQAETAGKAIPLVIRRLK